MLPEVAKWIKSESWKNAKYLAKFKTISIRFPLDEREKISEAAQREGKAVSAYTVQAVRERMERERGQNNGD